MNEERINQLREIVKIQSSNGNADYNAYMHGMANGLILALSIMENKDPKFLEFKKYSTDFEVVEHGQSFLNWLKTWK